CGVKSGRWPAFPPSRLFSLPASPIPRIPPTSVEKPPPRAITGEATPPTTGLSALPRRSSMRWTSPVTRRSEKKQRVTKPSAYRPALESLEDRTLLANRLDPFTTALSSQLDGLATSFRDAITSAQKALPVLN